MSDPAGLAGIFVAALGGAAIGVERQRSGHASGPRARFGGVRTFTLLGVLAGLAGWLATQKLEGFAVVLAAGAIALVVAGYAAASRRSIDATTEAAALLVIAAGLVAGLGWLKLASGTIAVTTLLLIEKSRLHALARRIDNEELRAAARFGVMAVVVLPLLPEGPYGPLGGIKPRMLWMLVLFFTGLSFTGYLSRRVLGPGRGYPLAGLLGGLVSSTNVTVTFARLSRRERAFAEPLAVGAIAASTMLFPRVLVAAAVLNLAVAVRLLPYLAAPLGVGVLATALSWRRRRGPAAHALQHVNPLQVGPALQMAGIFQVVLFAVHWMNGAFATQGLLASGAVLGLTDVDALTISMTTTSAAGSGAAIAAKAISVGILANCLLKGGLAMGLGAPSFRLFTGSALAAMCGTNRSRKPFGGSRPTTIIRRPPSSGNTGRP